jgi:diguanylate cyclase (GGDEF)-like protein
MNLARLKVLLPTLVFLAVPFFAPYVAAQDLILSSTTIHDASGALTIGDVAKGVSAHPGQPAKPSGGSQDVEWVRLRVHAPAPGSEVVLYISPSYLNEVRLYEAGEGDPSTWKTRVTGNFFPVSQRERASFSLGFPVNISGSEATYYLRVRSRPPLDFIVQALSPTEAMERDHRHDLLELFFVTSMVFLMLWGLHSYLLDRQRVVGLFVLFQAVYTLFGIAVTGYLAPVNPAGFPRFVDVATAILYLGVNFTSVLFCRELFRPYEPPPLLMRMLNGLLWGFPLLLTLLLLGSVSTAVNINNLLIKITWILFVVVAFSLRKEQTPGRRSLQIFFVGILLSMVFFWFLWSFYNGTAKVDVQLLSGFHHLIIDGLVMGALFALILHTRIRQTVREGQESAIELLLVQEKFKLEQELKRQIEIQAQTDYLTGIHTRRHFVELAEKELSRAIRFERPFTLLVIDVDHFKSINDACGHAVGDLVLQQIARVTSDALRSQDYFGRTGGEEFAVVLVEAEGASAIEAAQRLCASVSNAWIAPCDDCIPASVSIGLAQRQGRDIAFSQLLLEADRAMYSAKEAGRNRVFVSEEAMKQ